jgi:hypothetical protein
MATSSGSSHDQHALVDHAERLQPFDLGHAGARHAGIVGRIAEAGMGLQQRAVLAGELVEAEDQLIRGVVEPAKGRAGAEARIAGLGVARKHGLCALQRHRGRLDHALGKNSEHRLGEIE